MKRFKFPVRPDRDFGKKRPNSRTTFASGDLRKGAKSRFSLFISLITGNSEWRLVRPRLRPPPRFKYLTLLRYSNSAVCELSAVCGTSYRLADDHFHAETHSCGICGAQHAPVSFAEYSGTAVSRFSAEFAPGERDANERDDGQAIEHGDRAGCRVGKAAGNCRNSGALSTRPRPRLFFRDRCRPV